MDEQGHCAIGGQAVDTLHGSFVRIIEGLGESKRWISEVQVAVGFEHQIVRAVDLAPVVMVGKRYNPSVWFQPPDLSIAMATEDQSSLCINSEAIGAWLLAGERRRSAIAAVLHE
jgi:hypothetical protein